MMKNKDLKKRILSLSYKYKLSHIGSCLTAVDIIDEIYATKKKDEKFVLSCGHAGLALYVVIEKYEGIDAEKIWNHHGTHPDRCKECHIYCSSGSLGHGLPIAVGMALADRKKDVYCLISDGECSEGIIWEALRIAEEQKLGNLRIYCNMNGWGAYKEINNTEHSNLGYMLDRAIPMRSHVNTEALKVSRMMAEFHKNSPYLFMVKTNMNEWPIWLQGQEGHYHIMTEEEYEKSIL